MFLIVLEGTVLEMCQGKSKIVDWLIGRKWTYDNINVDIVEILDGKREDNNEIDLHHLFSSCDTED